MTHPYRLTPIAPSRARDVALREASGIVGPLARSGPRSYAFTVRDGGVSEEVQATDYFMARVMRTTELAYFALRLLGVPETRIMPEVDRALISGASTAREIVRDVMERQP